MAKKEPCAVGACDRHAEIGGLCKRCYSALRYAAKKPVGYVRMRLQKLDFYSKRLSYFEPTVKKIQRSKED